MTGRLTMGDYPQGASSTTQSSFNPSYVSPSSRSGYQQDPERAFGLGPLFAACLFFALLVVAGIVIALMTAGMEVAEASDGGGGLYTGGGGGGGSGGGGRSRTAIKPFGPISKPTKEPTQAPLPPNTPTPPVTVPPAPVPPTPVPPTPVPPTPVPPTTTPLTRASKYRELVCTVNRLATTPGSYPPDGLCHYLYYAEVFMVGDHVRPTVAPVSYNAFLGVARSYNMTGAGVAFHPRYATVEAVTSNASTGTDVALQLKLLRMQFGVAHYGIINVFARIRELRPLVIKLLKVLEVLKKYQRSFETQQPFDDKAGKTILAIGLYQYDELYAWRRYKELVKMLTTYDYVNTVITITTTVRHDDLYSCKTVPPDVLRSQDKGYPEIIQHAELMKESSTDVSPEAIIGLSLEMGAAFYYLMRTYGTLQAASYASPCEYRGFANLDGTCEEGEIFHLPQSSNAAFAANIYKKHRRDAIRSYIFFWDSKVTLFEKLEFLQALPLRKRFSWLYMDVNLADFTGQCTEKPWQNIEELKKAFEMGPTPEKGPS